MSDLGTAYVQVVPSAKDIPGTLAKEFGSGGDAAGKAAGDSIVSKMKGLIAGAAIGTTVVAGIKKAIGEGAALEQSMGGIETLFKGSADAVIKNAKKAYQTAGVSANEYMENVTSFSASLISSLDGDTTKAAKIADMAMVDMSDNANKMGTDIGSIQNAYQSFARGNYGMLDNLKLGYGGTKTEMERLLADASELSGVEYDMSNLSDVYEAIHVVQQELDITGTTSKEASTTIAGSFGSMKAAFTDLMGNLALGQDIGSSMQNLVDAAVTFLVGNLIPAIVNIMKSLPAAIASGLTAVASYIPENLTAMMSTAMDTAFTMLPQFLQIGMGIVDNILKAISAKLPSILKAGVALLTKFGTGVIKAIPKILSTAATLVTKLANFIAKNNPKIVSAGIKLIGGLASAFVKNLPKILASIGKLVVAVGKAFLKLAPLGLKAGWDVIKAIGSGIGKAIGGVIDKVKGVVDKILAPIKGVVDKVKGIFPVKLGSIFNGLKLPHFSVKGGKFPFGVAGKGSPPEWNVSWYAKGGIMTQPTLFGGGESGDEAIVPLDPFWKRLEEHSGNTINITMNVDGAENPEQWARRFTHSLELEMRTI